MRTFSRLLVLVLLWVPLVSFAQQCSVKGNENFDITVSITSYDPAKTYTVYYQKQGNKDPVLIWSNKQSVSGLSPVVYESSFTSGLNYQIKFFYDSSTREITYYHKLDTDTYWSSERSYPVDLDNGQSFFIENGASGIDCVGGENVVPPEPEPPKFEVCDYFQQPAQSWKPGSGAFFGSSQNNAEGTPYHLGGWTKAYTEKYESDFTFGGSGTQKILSIPFDRLVASRANINYSVGQNGANGSVSISYYDASTLYLTSQTTSGYDDWNYYSSCNGRECRIATGTQPIPPKIATPEPVNPTFTATKNLIIGPWNYDSECPVDGSSAYCKSTVNGNVRTIEIISDINNLQINGPTDGSRVALKFLPNASDTEYGIKVKEFNVTTGNVDVTFDQDGTYTFDIFHLSTRESTLTIDAKTLFKIKTLFQLSNSVPLTQLALPENFIIYGPDAIVDFAGSNKFYYGMFLAQNIQFNNPITFYGSVATNNLILPNDNSIVGLGPCIDPQPPTTTYTLDVTPDNQFALLCEAPEVTFTVYNQDGSVATDYDGTITATYPSGLTPENPTVGTKNSDYVYTPNNGVVVVPVDSDSLGEYTVSAQLSDDSDASDQGKLLFGPYKFSATPDPVKAVAGHPTQFDVQVLACKDDAVTPVQGYSGDKDLKISDINLTKPTLADGASDGNLQVSNSESGSYSASDVTLNFSDDAKASAYLKYMQSGSLNFALTDPDFVCPEEYDGCEVNNRDGTSENIESLTGIINVDVRPWTFAICEPNNRDMTGDSSGGEGFVAAGEKFALRVAPIVWQSGGSLTEDVDVENFCNANVTTNFFLTNAQTATVLMGADLETPTKGRLGSGIQSDDGLERAHNGVANIGDNYYSYTNLAWQEVGSLKINADTVADYLGMDINLGYRGVGRFYPHHLINVSNEWDYADGHYDFAYMNQPIGMKFTLEAQSADNVATQNYGFFDSSLQNGIEIVAVEKDGLGSEISSLDNRLDPGENTDTGWSDSLTGTPLQTSDRNAQYIANYADFKFLKDSTNNSPYTSVTDGPFDDINAKFGSYVSDMKDNLDFDYSTGIEIGTDVGVTTEHGLAFSIQPDFRYGRMALGNVSGPIGGPISVPLRTEYWDGNSFVTNTDDSGSQFKANVYYVMSNVTGSSAQLSSNSPSSLQNVSAGKSSVLRAQQVNSQRETVRLFLRQGNTSVTGGYGNSVEPVADDELNATNNGWNVDEDLKQPWLQYNWRNKGDEDPSTVVTFGSYRGNDRVIYRGEPHMMK